MTRNGWRKLATPLLTAAGLAIALYVMQPLPSDSAHRPSVLPDRIMLTWSADPATTQSVTWRTDTSVSHSYAQIAPAKDGPDFVTDARQIEAKTLPVVSDLGKYNYHEATFEDLQPKTKYLYRLGDGENWSAWNMFRTASEEPEPFSFIYFGDAQTEIRSHWSRVVRTAFQVAPEARFLLHAGDLVNRQGRDSDWGEWHQAGGWVNSVVPSLAVPGNHEYSHGVGRKTEQLSMYWRPQFEFPRNGPEGLQETTYWIDYQGARFIALNTNEKIREQADWLEKVLADNPNRWTIISHHFPFYSSSQGMGDYSYIKRVWQPLYDKYGVDLVLQGHDHSYGRSGLRTVENESTGSGTIQASGTVYVVSVSGPKMRRRNNDEFASSAEGIQLFQVISIAGDQLKYEARTATGRIHDAFTLFKREGQPNELLEERSATERTASQNAPFE